MSNPEYVALHILHVASVLILFGFTFYAFAAGPETRKKVMIWTGVANLLIIVSGVRMWQAIYGFNPFGWVIVKLIGWLVLAGLAGLAYRRREKVGLWSGLALAIGVISVIMVYAQPF
jgi:hypothetical protein